MKRVLSVLVAVVIVGAFSVYSEEKGLDDVPSGPGTTSEATGGPDAFGYSWADQAEANCAYQFVDISGTGTDLGDGLEQVALLAGEAFGVVTVALREFGGAALELVGGEEDEVGGFFRTR